MSTLVDILLVLVVVVFLSGMEAENRALELVVVAIVEKLR